MRTRDIGLTQFTAYHMVIHGLPTSKAGAMRIKDVVNHLRVDDNYTYKLNAYDITAKKQ